MALKNPTGKMPFTIVVAATLNTQGIGVEGNTLPWRLPGDLKFFKNLTTTTQDPTKQNAVIMGRKTYLSIPEKVRPLPGRLNMILTKASTSFDLAYPGVIVSDDFDAALDYCRLPLSVTKPIETCFVTGGGQVYKEALLHPQCQAIYLTRIKSPSFPQCTIFLPPIDDKVFELVKTIQEETIENGIIYDIVMYKRRN